MKSNLNLGVWNDVRFNPKVNYDIHSDHSGAIGMSLAQSAFDQANIDRALEEGELVEQRVKYEAFLAKSGNLRDSEEMRVALVTHFPNRFGRSGKQPLTNYSSDDVFGVYQGVLRSAKKLVSR